MATRVFAKVSDVLAECKDIPVSKELHRQILGSGLNAVFPDLEVVEHEYQAGSAKFNTLAYDTKRQRFAVVEYMRGENGLASRVIQYGDELKNEWHQNNILALCKLKLKNKSPDSWPGAYVIGMADHFSDRDKELASQDKLNLPTELHIVRRPHPAIMVIESVNVIQIAENKLDISISKLARKPGRPAKGTMGFFLSGRSNKIRDLGFTLEAALAKLHLKPHIPESNQYARFRRGKNTVCAVNIARSRLRIYYTIKRDAGVERPGFVYAVKHHLGKYASDIKTIDDILPALRVVQAVCESKLGRGPWSGLKVAGASGLTETPTAKKTSKPGAYTFVINGRQFKAVSAISALKQIFEYLPQVDGQFLEKFDALKHGRTRRYVARNKSRLYPSGYAEADTYSYEIASAPGWWLGTNYSVKDIKKIAAMAKETANRQISRTMSGDIFGAAPRGLKPKGVSARTRPKKRGVAKAKSKTVKSARSKKPPKAKARHTFHMNGRRFEAASAIDALKQIFEYLPQVDGQFLEKFNALEHGRVRRYVSRDKSKLYRQGYADAEERSYEIASAPGWWLGTNYGTVAIKKIAAMARETVRSEIGRTMSGDIFGAAPRGLKPKGVSARTRPKKRGVAKAKSKTAKSARSKKPPKAKARHTFHMNGRRFEAASAIDALKQIFEYLPRVDPRFLEKFDALEHGKKRRYVSQDRTKLYPNSSLAVSKHVMEISAAPGWWMGTNYSVENIRHIAALAKKTADPKISRTMAGGIFGSDANAPKHPKRARLVTDGGLKIPPNENVENEFKSSFRHDYRAARHKENGDQNLAQKQQDLVRKTNYGHGLEWDIAKAVAGFANSTVKKGRIWVGIKEGEGQTPAVLGLREDMVKSKSKNLDDDFGNWINDLLKSCIRDYASFANVKISYPRVDGKQICMLEITMASEPMYLFAKGNPSDTMFYKRNNSAPRTDLLSGANLMKYIAFRFKP